MTETRKCSRCLQSFPAITEFFVKDKTRLLGISYECRQCHAARKKGRDRRKERWINMTFEQKTRRKESQKRYSKTLMGRAVFLRKAYEATDFCDMSTKEVAELIKQPCTYCGTLETNRGLDRINNNLPHIKSNVVPCCAPCNFARGDRFTMEEMLIIGKVIRKVISDRLSKEVGNEDRQETPLTKKPT